MVNPSAAENFIANTYVTEKTPIVAGIDAFINNYIIGGFDAMMNNATAFVAENIGKGAATVSTSMDAMNDKFFTPEAGAEAAVPLSKQVALPEIAPAIPEHVLASAKTATMGMSNGFQYTEAANDHNFAPIGINAQGQSMGGGIGMG